MLYVKTLDVSTTFFCGFFSPQKILRNIQNPISSWCFKMILSISTSTNRPDVWTNLNYHQFMTPELKLFCGVFGLHPIWGESFRHHSWIFANLKKHTQPLKLTTNSKRKITGWRRQSPFGARPNFSGAMFVLGSIFTQLVLLVPGRVTPNCWHFGALVWQRYSVVLWCRDDAWLYHVGWHGTVWIQIFIWLYWLHTYLYMYILDNVYESINIV